MISFSNFIVEEFLTEASEVSNDDKGKLHELLLAKHLLSHLDPKGEGVMPGHFRADPDHPNKKIKGKSPSQVHDEIRNRIGEEEYQKIHDHAKQTSMAMIDHMIKTGRIKDRNDITNVHWTSNRDTEKKAGDHEKLTGEKDVNANGDLIVSVRGKNGSNKPDFVPVSAKYGTEAKPNYRNDGFVGMETKAGLKPGSLTNIQTDMERELESTYGHRHGLKAGGDTQATRHSLFKQDLAELEKEQKQHKEKVKQALADHIARGGKKKNFVAPEFKPKSAAAKAAQGARDIGVKHRKRMAATMAAGFQQMSRTVGSDQPIRDFISQQVSPSVKYRHLVAHSHVQGDGSANSIVHDMDEIAPHHLSQFENIEAVHGSREDDEEGGVSVNFYGTHKGTGKRLLVATQSIKGGSGPYKGSNGTFRINPVSSKVAGETAKGDEPNTMLSSDTKEPVSVPQDTPASATVYKAGPRLPYSRKGSGRVPQTDSPIASMSTPGIRKRPPSQRIAPNGYPEHMPQAHKDNSIGGHQDSGI
jgi:hypothetical protein